ncbi:MAG: hypothetical protein ACYTFX_06625 [Planctomycetota bacterium]|jgi:hypothetical protein
MPDFKLLLRALLTVFLFGIITFLTGGIGECLWHLIEVGNKVPEMLGWWGTFVWAGIVYLIVTSGALLVNCVFAIFSEISYRWIFICASVEAFSISVLFLISIHTFGGSGGRITITSWLLCVLFAIIGCKIISDLGENKKILMQSKIESAKSAIKEGM